MVPQVVRGDTALLAPWGGREAVTPWETEGLLAVAQWTHTSGLDSLTDAIARAFRIQRQLPDDATLSPRDVRRAIRWRAFHEARVAFGGPWAGWRRWVPPAAALCRAVWSEAAVRHSTSHLKTDALRRLVEGFDAPSAGPAPATASARHVAARWASRSGLAQERGAGR